MRTFIPLLLLLSALSCKKEEASDPAPREMSARISRAGAELLAIDARGDKAGFALGYGYYAATCRNDAGAEVILNFGYPYGPGTYPAQIRYSMNLSDPAAPVYIDYGGPNGGTVSISSISDDGVLAGTYSVPCVSRSDTVLVTGAFNGKF
ncbi:MAG: hypothetical protein EOO11_18655 [Chitinophagaceae bacterium]|nr:MAG: hypothetical protein EOO11_18655 [Chitinophagaceae bacterium]